MQKRLLLFCVALFGSVQFSISQNLIPNPCFENYPLNRSSYTYAFHAKHWFTLNKSTPDLFFPENTIEYRLPVNYMGKENSFCGTAYAGAFLIFSNHRKQFNNMTEYLATKLIHPLEKDTLYCISFYTRLADNCLYATNGMDVLFAKKLKKNKYSGYMNLNSKYQPQLRNIGNGVIENTEWRKVCSVYQAQGGEKYIAIGNFNRIEDIQIKELDRKIKNPTSSFYCAYYYFDNISLLKISSPEECDCTAKDTLSIVQANADSIEIKDEFFSKDEAMILNNVFFETDQWELLPGSFLQLDSIVDYMNRHKHLIIEISGHTDNIGNEQHNIQLSQARAQSVASYLIAKGIQSNRIIVKGYGSSKQVNSNETDAGRAKNRRVEIFLFDQ